MERREFLGGAAAGVVAGAATVIGKSQAETNSDTTKPMRTAIYIRTRGGSPSHSLLPSDPALRVKAIETLLIEKGLVDPAAVDAIIDQFEHKLGPKIGAAVVAKAWADPAFKKALMENAPKALAGIGVVGNGAEQIIAVENTDKVHNVVVCTLCSLLPVGECSACRPRGTSRRPTARGWCASHARSSPNSGSICLTKPRYAYGIRTPRCVTSSCRSAPKVPRP